LREAMRTIREPNECLSCGLPRRWPPGFIALVRPIWVIPGSAGGAMAVVGTALALIVLTMVAAIRKDALSGADRSAGS